MKIFNIFLVIVIVVNIILAIISENLSAILGWSATLFCILTNMINDTDTTK